jgi:hypothetical protein
MVGYENEKQDGKPKSTPEDFATNEEGLYN